jgi:hypothetical protein
MKWEMPSTAIGSKSRKKTASGGDFSRLRKGRNKTAAIPIMAEMG